jgi:hypothetical protein
MGTFYQNVTLRGAAPEAVVAVLAELGRTAFVTKPAGPITVVFDSEVDAMRSATALQDLAGTLSVRLKCPALAAGEAPAGLGMADLVRVRAGHVE